MRPLLVLLALACPAWAQTIEGPASPVPPHRLARLSVAGAESVAWVVLPVGAADLEVSPDTTRCVFAAPPGSYTVLAATVKGGKVAFLSASVVIGGAPPVPPGPGPDPRPDPTPTPPPALGTIHATLVYDAETATPAVGDLKSDGAMVEQLIALDCRWYAVEKDSAEFKRWWPERRPIKPPVVVFVSEAMGKVLAEIPPTSPADVLATARKLRGK